jgi:hypothetical protein
MRTGNRFAWGLAVIVLGALALRCGYIAGAKSESCTQHFGGVAIGVVHSECLGGDGFVNDQYWYNVTADEVSHGRFFRDPPPGDAPKADHPPLTVFVLAGASFAFEHLPLSALSEKPRTVFGTRLETHVREQRYTMAVIGAFVVLLVGLLGRRVGGDRVGLVAALIAAVYPNMWVNDGLLFAEPIARVCVLGALLLAVKYSVRASTPTAFMLGALCGFAALARSELLLLLPALAIPIAWSIRRAGARSVVVALLAATAGTAVVIGPWVAFNMARFEEPVFIATNDGVTLAGSNCDSSYYGSGTGLWTLTPPCTFSETESAKFSDQSRLAHAYRTKAFDYIRAHAKRVPLVVAARIARTWGLYRPLDEVAYQVNENKERWVSWAGLLSFYPVFVAAIAGAVVLLRRRRRFELWIVSVPLLTTTIVVALASGQVRLRAIAEPSLTVLAAVAVCSVWSASSASDQPQPAQTPPAV